MPSTEEHTTLSISRVRETRTGNKNAQLVPWLPETQCASAST